MLESANPLLVVSIILIAGTLLGSIVKRFRMPSVTGQIVAGFLIGPSVLGLFEYGHVDNLQSITNFALGLVSVAVGNHLNFRKLRNAYKRLLILLVFESILTPLLIILAMLLFPSMDWTMSVMLGALAVSTAPATIVALIAETRSKGVFVKTLVGAVALNNLACILLFEIAHAAAKVGLDVNGQHSEWLVLISPLKQLGASIFLGGSVGIILVIGTRKIVRPEKLTTASLTAILIVTGLADYLNISTMLASMFLGLTLANLSPGKDNIGHKVFANLENAIFTIFFTLAGMKLNLDYAISGGLIALVVVVVRMSGKLASGYFAMKLAGTTDRVRKYLGSALIPQAGVAVGLLILVNEEPQFAAIKDLFLAVGLTSVLFNEIIGPVLTRFSLVRSGDYGKNRARLIDFIHEENIVVDMKAKDKEDAIRQLLDLMIQSHNTRINRKHLLASILERENEMSTCIGSGLAIPHGILEKGDRIIATMGISREGLRIPTPDGKPVHCMVLLATPPSQRDRHLEVLAALARAIGSDRNIQKQIFTAKSPAHVHEILHAEEAEDFNYFLED